MRPRGIDFRSIKKVAPTCVTCKTGAIIIVGVVVGVSVGVPVGVAVGAGRGERVVL